MYARNVACTCEKTFFVHEYEKFYKISKLSKDLMLKTRIILGTISCIKLKLVHEIYYL